MSIKLQYLVAMICGCYACVILLPVGRKFFARFVAFRAWGPFLETPDNFPGPKTILGAQYSPIAIQFLLILKAKF